MPFKYRLEKVLKIREGELDEAILEVKRSEDHLRKIAFQLSSAIEERNELHTELINEGYAHASVYINSMKKLNDDIKQLEVDLQNAQTRLIEAKAQVLEAKKKLEALKKHKEKKLGEFVEEEKRRESLRLDEIGVLKHARELLESAESK